MKVVVQRVKEASVSVDNKITGEIDNGLLILVGFTYNDNLSIIEKMVDKVLNLRIFDDENNIPNKSVIEIKGSILSVSQFTLYAQTKKGRRPSYVNALNGDEAIKLYNKFNDLLKEKIKVETGIFGASMQVKSINDGPMTIIIESDELYDKK